MKSLAQEDSPQSNGSLPPSIAADQPVEEPNWKEIFEITAQQRDEATRNLHNLQIQLHMAIKAQDALKAALLLAEQSQNASQARIVELEKN